MDYKKTLNLPKTDFPMKGDLPRREQEFLKKWQELDLYGLTRTKPHPKGRYVLHDGPPYANGNIHIGHALNKTLKDIIVKYKTMRGFDSPYVPGWDCHGLPVEHQLFKELKINKYQIGQVEFRKKAHDYAMKYVAIQREEFKRLGVFGDWDDPYLTLSRDYEESIVSSFSVLVKKGYIYRGLKPVNWCYTCETALAEAEVEYEDHASPSIFVKFRLEGSPRFPGESFLVIWTTTPWTLIANVAVAVHPDFVYSYIQTARGNLIIANVRLSVLSRMGIEKYEVIREVKGKELEGLVYSHPFGLRTGRVVLAEYVSLDEGTGMVHTAPGHGAEDFLTGVKYKLDAVMPVDAKGNFDETAGEFKGQNVYEANVHIIEKLKNLGVLLLAEKIQHSYPHCWRCKYPIIFRATNQWFLKIDHNGLRDNLLREIRDAIAFIPEAGRERISSMVQLRPDWCLSRQRYWGVPIPSVVCTKCKEELLVPEVIDAFRARVAAEGSDCWFIRPVTDFVPKGFQCPQCTGGGFSKGSDILDVWFDSGVSHQAVLKKRTELGGVPCALYLEGSDQHRGWFQSSLIPAMCIDGKTPFESVLTHGHVVDGEGRKMSKSMGNVIPPQDIIKELGADIVRLWVASSDYNEDIRISGEILKRLTEAYRKIRNTARFILSNLYDFDPDKNSVAFAQLRKIDKRILEKQLDVYADVVVDGYEKFQFNKAYKAIYDFCNEDLSMSYLDMVKGRLYTAAADSPERRSAQTVMYGVLSVLVRLMAPILVFTAEDIWQHMPKNSWEKDIPSVHLLSMPDPDEIALQTQPPAQELRVSVQMEKIFLLLADVTKALEEKRSSGLIGSSFDAQIKLLTKDKTWYKYVESLQEELPEIFKVSLVSVTDDESLNQSSVASSVYPEIKIAVEIADGAKCERCWNYDRTVGMDAAHAALCGKCVQAVRQQTDQ